MSEDIFSSWKDKKFLLAQDYGDYDHPVILLTNISFWYTHYSELWSWCDQNGCKISGMTVVLPDTHRVTLFTLRWS
jgi:hypothetical protein